MSPMKCKSRGTASKLSLDLTTWPPKLKRLGGSSGEEEDASRPRTATLDKPRVLDADLLGRIDMTRITRRGLLALAGIVTPATTEQDITPRRRTHRLNRTFRVPALSSNIAEECFVRPVIGEDVPQPCRTCGRAELPERLHSHPVSKVRDDKSGVSAPCAVRRPVPIKYRPKGTNLLTPKNESPVRSPVNGKATRKRLICYICGRDIGSTPLEFHEPTCLAKWVEQRKRLPAQLHSQQAAPKRPPAHLSPADWNREAALSAQTKMSAPLDLANPASPTSKALRR